MLFDTNILVYSYDVNSPNHKVAQKLRDAVNEGKMKAAIAPQNLLELYSTITNVAKNENPASPNEAILEVKKFLASRFELIELSGRELETTLLLIKGNHVTSRRIFDVYLVATMLSNGIKTIYTANERDFEIFKGIKAVNPFK
ncbi:hypothetical protein A3I53_03945 [Candidatus Curtissbacteria bacterium RIFCSPLOWO2_02_FULL_40_13b]|uniref:Ribonuclease VapC n=1 Tax=Candidatus Curtissbacteria bacterium RIFCSPLOWO2_02_FULL_40_13b TaxID=1797733 RepID=A0A1F5HYE0_9BACT|nr:MAG: hypothetical protein A3I53_03945 [Candidatus Curtissbacteria bacterium RIFCSPLOWO2_02_FULL_40_13b]